jgi:hypothetical protein
MKLFQLSSSLLIFVTLLNSVCANPVISSISPTILPIFGATLTIAGTGFHSQTITYVQIGSLPQATSFTVNSDTQIVATFSASIQEYANQNVFVAWGTTSYTELTSAVSYVKPVITSVSCVGNSYMNSWQANTITINGAHFGTSASAYTYVQLGSFPVASSFTVVSDTQMTALFHGTGYDTAKQNLYVAWGSSAYAELVSAICWCCDGVGSCGSNTCYNSPCYL